MVDNIPFEYLSEIVGEEKANEIIERLGGMRVYIPKLAKIYADRVVMYRDLRRLQMSHCEALKHMSEQLGVSYHRLHIMFRDKLHDPKQP